MVVPVPATATVPVTDPTTQLKLPPGFRFYPTDEELMLQYLHPKINGHNFPLQIIGDIDLYKFDPWELPSKAMFGEKEWYFFSPRDRKYPNGSRPNRVAGSGYWKATGSDKMIVSAGRKVGIKKALVFYAGRAPRGNKTNWIMHEYRVSEPSAKDHSLRLDDWVLCRIYKKNSSAERAISGAPITDQSYGSPSSSSSQFDDALDPPPIDNKFPNFPTNNSVDTFIKEDQKVNIQKLDSENDDWMNVGQFGLQDPINVNNPPNGPISGPVDPTFDMQMKFSESPETEVHAGIRSQRIENSGYLYSQRFVNSTDPFAIRYPTRQSSSGYRR